MLSTLVHNHPVVKGLQWALHNATVGAPYVHEGALVDEVRLKVASSNIPK